MDIQVALDRLRSMVDERGAGASVLTVSADGSPHAVQQEVHWDGSTLLCDVGARTAGNASARPRVSLLFPPADPTSSCTADCVPILVSQSRSGSAGA